MGVVAGVCKAVEADVTTNRVCLSSAMPGAREQLYDTSVAQVLQSLVTAVQVSRLQRPPRQCSRVN